MRRHSQNDTESMLLKHLESIASLLWKTEELHQQFHHVCLCVRLSEPHAFKLSLVRYMFDVIILPWTSQYEVIFDDLRTMFLLGMPNKNSVKVNILPHSPRLRSTCLCILFCRSNGSQYPGGGEGGSGAPPQVLAPPSSVRHSCLLEPRCCSPFILESQKKKKKKVAIY